MNPTSADVVRRFDSIGDIIRHVQAGSYASGYRCASHTPSTDTDRFYMSESFDKACEMALGEWHGARSAISGMIANLQDLLMRAIAPMHFLTHDVTGPILDIAAFSSGDPECFLEQRSTVDDTDNVITILVSLDYSGSYSGDQVLRRGAMILALTEMIMSFGKSVAIYGETATQSYGGKTHSVLVCLKSADQYADIDDLAFAVAHPAWLRRIVFGLFEIETPQVQSAFGIGPGRYGSPGHIKCGPLVDATVTIDRANSGTDQSAVDYVVQTLTNLGLIAEN